MSLEVVSTIFWCHCSHITVTAAVLLLLLLSYYCCFHITPVTSAFPGAAELTTQLLRLISILYLPLCRINKFGFYFPRRLLRSPILVGHQDYFLAPLPGSIALFGSSLGLILFAANSPSWVNLAILRSPYYHPLQEKVQLLVPLLLLIHHL